MIPGAPTYRLGMRPPTKSIQPRIAVAAALGAIASSGMVLAGCGGDGPEGAPPPPATTKAAPARSAAPATEAIGLNAR